jgi:hypothetical protein
MGPPPSSNYSNYINFQALVQDNDQGHRGVSTEPYVRPCPPGEEVKEPEGENYAFQRFLQRIWPPPPKVTKKKIKRRPPPSLHSEYMNHLNGEPEPFRSNGQGRRSIATEAYVRPGPPPHGAHRPLPGEEDAEPEPPHRRAVPHERFIRPGPRIYLGRRPFGYLPSHITPTPSPEYAKAHKKEKHLKCEVCGVKSCWPDSPHWGKHVDCSGCGRVIYQKHDEDPRAFRKRARVGVPCKPRKPKQWPWRHPMPREMHRGRQDRQPIPQFN